MSLCALFALCACPWHRLPHHDASVGAVLWLLWPNSTAANLLAAGEGLVVSNCGPGVFLQGLTAYGLDGSLVAGGALGKDVVRQAMAYAGAFFFFF